ncbi:MAG: peptidase MA family metallohydrolase, partial [Nannocystaceae bacterium]
MADTQLGAFQLAAASRSAEMALQTNPHHAQAQAVLARIELVEGKQALAATRVKDQVLQQNPHSLEGLAIQAALALRADDKSGYATIRAAAVGHARDGGIFFTRLAELLVSLHMYPEADTVLAKAVALAPKNPRAQSAYGLNLLRLGEETKGRAALEAAWKRDRFNERTLNTLELYRQTIDPKYTDVKAKQLSLRVPTLDHEWLADDLVAAYARARKSLDARYGIDPGVLRLEAFDTPETFSLRTLGVPSFGALGVCFGKVITLVGNHRGTHNLHQVIWHELAHVYAIRLSRGRVPRWFTEGLSEWESELADPSWARESAELLAAARRQGKMRRLEELELAFLRAESPAMMEVAYATASYAMRYLGRTYGVAKLKAILQGYGAGKTTEELFSQHFGKDLATVSKDFDTWMVAQISAKVTGWHPKPGRGKKQASATPDPRDKLLAQAVTEARAKDYEAASRTLQKLIGARGDGYHARMMLGEVLLQGPSWKSAKQHFEKAHGFHTESIDPLSKLAQLAQRSGDVAGEIKVLTTAIEIDGMSFDPAARLVVLATLADAKAAQKKALTRAVAIAPLHPISLAGR